MQFTESFPEGHPRSSSSSQSSHSSRRLIPLPQSATLAPPKKSSLKSQNKPESPQKTTGTLKKSRSIQALKALRTIANPIKTRREEKARRHFEEMKEREEAERNVQDFLVEQGFTVSVISLKRFLQRPLTRLRGCSTLLR